MLRFVSSFAAFAFLLLLALTSGCQRKTVLGFQRIAAPVYGNRQVSVKTPNPAEATNLVTSEIKEQPNSVSGPVKKEITKNTSQKEVKHSTKSQKLKTLSRTIAPLAVKTVPKIKLNPKGLASAPKTINQLLHTAQKQNYVLGIMLLMLGVLAALISISIGINTLVALFFVAAIPNAGVFILLLLLFLGLAVLLGILAVFLIKKGLEFLKK